MEHPIPGYPEYFANEEGDIISYKRGKRRVLAQKPQKNARSRKQVKLYQGKELHTMITHRVIVMAKLGRKLEQWEQVRHLDSNRNNNRMDNLTVGCAILNMIDDIEQI